MKRSFLDTLIGMDVLDAQGACLNQGYNSDVYQNTDFIAAPAKVNTVVLVVENAKVIAAIPSDIWELDDDLE